MALSYFSTLRRYAPYRPSMIATVIGAWLLMVLCVNMAGVAQQTASPTEKKSTADTVAPPLALERKQFPQGEIFVLKVPVRSGYKVIPAVSKTLLTLKSPGWQSIPQPGMTGQKPLFIINGGFFDPGNSLTTSFIFQGGSLVADPRINPNLVSNEKLVPYLPKIFNRPELRLYLCQGSNGSFQTQYDITPRNASIPKDCLLQSSLGAGPTLLPQVQDLAEGFVDYNAAGKRTRDPIGVCALNARSAVGITAKGDILLLMGAQNASKPGGSGFTLSDVANLLKARGAVKAMALDGGSSSSLWYQGQTIFGKYAANKAPVIRPVKSVLMVVPST
ncbi:phosphodiester glycosidase family protein [Vampirovibrio chlorellavorus]|uniref:phosphodiester glycosidase family protein n=1 Tax=Vampirovibrio chlorellavorus TaxID=758823 RepID=UPI0026EF363D|nr:phosphodiester glycosidase family protein [Vampirovibrio chlorellavorus]